MLHAKTAVADGMWSRVGSTNLNVASWLSNYELDVAIEDAAFARQMAAQYEKDLARSTEIVLTRRNRVRRSEPSTDGEAEAGVRVRRAVSGSAGRAAAGAVSVGSALGAALTNRRTLGTAEVGMLTTMAVFMLGTAALAAAFPRLLAWPIALFAGWIGVAWGFKAWLVWHGRSRAPLTPEIRREPDEAEPAGDRET
jgi:cardiolipin synthase